MKTKTKREMKMRRAALTGIFVGALIQSTGCCSLVGLGVGAMVDSGTPNGPIPPERWEALAQGTEVDLVLRDGPPFRTHFLGLSGASMMVVPGPPWMGSPCDYRGVPSPVWIPQSSVVSIRVNRSAKKTGLAIGVAADVVLGIIALSQWDPMDHFNTSISR